MNVLLLDVGWRPINIIELEDAIRLLFQENEKGKPKAELLASYAKPIKTARGNYPRPAVVKLNHFIKFNMTRVTFSYSAVFIRDGYTCQYCDKKLYKSQCTVDHIVPKSKGGRDSFKNLVCCCGPCNSRKGDTPLEESGMKLLRAPVTPVWPNTSKTPDEWREFLF